MVLLTRIIRLVIGTMVNISIAKHKNTNTYSLEGKREARRTDVKTAAFNDTVPMNLHKQSNDNDHDVGIVISLSYFGELDVL